jgi:hypothetical protein
MAGGRWTGLAGSGEGERARLGELLAPIVEGAPDAAWQRVLSAWRSSRVDDHALTLELAGHYSYARTVRVTLARRKGPPPRDLIGRPMPRALGRFLRLFAGIEVDLGARKDDTAPVLNDFARLQKQLKTALALSSRTPPARASQLVPFRYRDSDFTLFHYGFRDASGDPAIITLEHDGDGRLRPTAAEAARHGFGHWLLEYLGDLLGSPALALAQEVQTTRDLPAALVRYLAGPADAATLNRVAMCAHDLWNKGRIEDFLRVFEAFADGHADARDADGDRFVARFAAYAGQDSDRKKVEQWVDHVTKALAAGGARARRMLPAAQKALSTLDPQWFVDLSASEQALLQKGTKGYDRRARIAELARMRKWAEPLYERLRPFAGAQRRVEELVQDGQYADAIAEFHATAELMWGERAAFSDMLANAIAAYLLDGRSPAHTLGQLERYFAAADDVRDRERGFAPSELKGRAHARLVTNMAGLYALDGQVNVALPLIKQAIALGMAKQHFRTDSDFVALRSHATFRKLIR